MVSILAAHLIGLAGFVVGLAIGAWAGIKLATKWVVWRALDRGISRGDILAFCELIKTEKE